MTQFEGRTPAGPTLQDAEALVRSLVGVAAVRISAASDGTLNEVVVVPESDSMGRQVIRNVTSALMARFGFDLHPDSITLAAPAADTQRRNGHTDAGAPPSVAGPGMGRRAPVRTRGNGYTPLRATDPPRNGNAPNGAAGQSNNGTADAETARNAEAGGTSTGANAAQVRTSARARPATVRPRLELVELDSANGSSRCRVVVAAGSERFVGVGDGDDGRIADIELAGRVAVDALRAARTPRDPIQFEGAVLVDIAGRAHVAVSLSVWNGSHFDTIAGAAPVDGSPADSAAQAVIDSIVARLTT